MVITKEKMKKETVLKEAAGSWKRKMKESGVEFVKSVRKEWEKRKVI